RGLQHDLVRPALVGAFGGGGADRDVPGAAADGICAAPDRGGAHRGGGGGGLMSLVLHINGWPGCGKLTIGPLVAEHLGALFDDYRAFARGRSSRLVSAVLDCDLDENLQRLARPGRAEQRKLTRAAVLRDLRAKYSLLKPEGVERIDLDVTQLSAEGAAAA